MYKVALGKKVAAGEKVLLKVRCSTVGVLRPLPGTGMLVETLRQDSMEKKEQLIAPPLPSTPLPSTPPPHTHTVKQGENQKVDFNDNAYYLSKYQTKTQSTTVQLASPTVESYSSESGSVTKASDTLTFGDYANVAPLSQKPLRFHGVNNKPFCAARTLKRVLEVSMWGNLAVEEWYQIEHVGARLKGSFSRLDYGQSARAAPSSFTTLTARLPAQAQDIYFRDDIGNISTSKVSNPSKGTREVAFTQRFPMFGGWKTRFYYGYNLPLGEVMTTAGGLNRLRVPLASPVRDIWVQDMTVEVILPEGVPTPEVFIAGEKTDDFTVEKRSTYLDYSGRTVVILKASQLALPERNEELEIVFRFSSSLLGDLVWEPLYLITGFLAIFGSVIFASRVLA